MRTTTLAFVWHMHQPYYRDTITGDGPMPWVRLHGIHSYYDMLRLYEKFPTIKGTINFVPSLVEQLLQYIEGGQKDAFLVHTEIPAEHLTPQQKAFILQNFFMANPECKIQPYPAYHKLYARRGLDPARIDFQQAIRFFSTQDYLDLQIFYNLVWFGFTAREEIPEIDKMLSSGGHFTEDDKRFVIESQYKILKNLFGALGRAATSQNVEICTTPYYHPILPLLIDTSIAARARPKAPLPHSVKVPWIAEWQLKNALDSMERWTGRRPKGLWPAEGGVCPEMIPMLADAGIEWFATDEKILSLSFSGTKKEINKYQPFLVKFGDKAVNCVFRDQGLADLIGFTYKQMPAEAAVENFLGHLNTIDGLAKSERLVTVILDGENAWEFYPNSGKGFLTGLFSAFEKQNIPTTTIAGYLLNHKPTVTIENLHSGSWIDANFHIWIGKPHKNQAWEYIRKTIDELGESLGLLRRPDKPKAAKALESLSAACGSDWFWWYDDDFESAFKADYDRIFRQHLKNVFNALGKDIPPFLFEPIYQFKDTKGYFAEPAGFMEPSIDGKRTSFFEWANAVRYNVRGRGGAMALSSERFETISFGFNTSFCFLRIDPVNVEEGFSIRDDEELIIYLHDTDKHQKFCVKKAAKGFELATFQNAGDGKPTDAPICWACERVLEMAIPFGMFGFKPGEKLTIAIALHRLGVEVRRYSHINFMVPDETYEQKMWSV